MRKFIAAAGFAGAFFIAAFSSLSTAQARGGLFEALFGQPQPTYYQYAPAEGLRFRSRPDPAPAMRGGTRLRGAPEFGARKPKARKAARRVVSLDPRIGLATPKSPMQKAICCKGGEDPARAILSDATLRPGDAYMTPQGLRVFVGRAGAKAAAAFVAPRRAAISKKDRARLVAISDARPRAVQAKAKAEAGSAAPAQLIVDPAGRALRAVGPYQTYYDGLAPAPRSGARRI